MLPHEVKSRIETGLPSCSAYVSEFSGGTDHYSVVVVTPAFESRSLLQRHRLVYALFDAEMATGEVHALTIRAFTPGQWETEGPKLLPHFR